MGRKKLPKAAQQKAAAAVAAAAAAAEPVGDFAPGAPAPEVASPPLDGVSADEGEEGFDDDVDDLNGDGPVGKVIKEYMQKNKGVTMRQAIAAFRIAASTLATYRNEFRCVVRYWVLRSDKAFSIVEDKDPSEWIPALKAFVQSEVREQWVCAS